MTKKLKRCTKKHEILDVEGHGECQDVFTPQDFEGQATDTGDDEVTD